MTVDLMVLMTVELMLLMTVELVSNDSWGDVTYTT